MTILLGLAAGLCWGVGDFFGGVQSRRLPILAVALWSQLAGGLALVAVLVAVGGEAAPAGLLWGIGGGLFSGGALLLLYRGLATGIMSVVAPISACGALVPVFVGLARGEVPGVFASLGIVAALAGITVVSLQARPAPVASRVAAHESVPARGGAPLPHGPYIARGALLLALGAALGFGMFFVLVRQGSADGTSPLWVVAGARVGSLMTMLSVIVLGRRPAPWPGRQIGTITIVGLLDTAANALFAYAAWLGDLGVAAVLASLYPVATVLLGRLVLDERLTRLQAAGVAMALAGVALIAAD